MVLDKIYTREEIEKAKQSPSFEREYNLKYLGLVGNLFRPDTIEKAQQLGLQYPRLSKILMVPVLSHWKLIQPLLL